MPTRLIAALALLAVSLAIPIAAHAQTTTVTTTTTTVTTTTVTTTTVSTTTTTTTTTNTTTVTTTTTTTTTTSTTTTTLGPTQVITACVNDSDQPLGSGKYHVSGHFVGAASYHTGGMVFATKKNLKATAQCLCNSFARKPINVLFTPVNGRTFTYDSSAQAVLAYSTSGTQVTATTDLSGSTINFYSVCQ